MRREEADAIRLEILESVADLVHAAFDIVEARNGGEEAES